jgi:E3 ubiquitin-protein ligase RNF8
MALEEVKKKLEGELEIKEKQLQEISANSITKDDLQEEFTCSICQELILCAMTIECSHSFCNTCISDWLERKKVF